MRRPTRFIILLTAIVAALLSFQVSTANAEPDVRKETSTNSDILKSTKTVRISAEVRTIPIGRAAADTACYNTLQGEVWGTGFGPAGGPYTLAYVDATWSSGVNCVPSNMRMLASTSALYFNNSPVAYSVRDECTGVITTCSSVLSPGAHKCTGGVACAGNYNISGNHEMVLFAPEIWASYGDNCWLGDETGQWLLCVTASGDVTIPPVWYD